MIGKLAGENLRDELNLPVSINSGMAFLRGSAYGEESEAVLTITGEEGTGMLHTLNYFGNTERLWEIKGDTLLTDVESLYCYRIAPETDEPAAPEASAAPAAILPAELLFTAAEEEYMEDPQETEKIEEALLAQGYFSLAVPMPYEWQDYMRTYCEEYGCPYPLALAVAQTESNFDMDAVGASGEVGIMQLNPGPGGSYHAEIQAATGLDPTTASGNIAGGCYKLGLYLAKYGSAEKAAMAYNMGEGGARSAWDSGITSTDYSKAVKEAMETWECTVNAWGGV